jgi:hypothetical protein
MKHRAFITLVGGAAASWPIAPRAQQAAKPARIGFLGADTQSGVESRLERFRAGLRHLGYVEGDNVFIDFRWAEGNYARLSDFAAELVRLKVDLLVTCGTPGDSRGQKGHHGRPDCYDCERRWSASSS